MSRTCQDDGLTLASRSLQTAAIPLSANYVMLLRHIEAHCLLSRSRLEAPSEHATLVP